jgi:hypothetical protein
VQGIQLKQTHATQVPGEVVVMASILISGGTVSITMSANQRVISGRTVRAENGRIAEVEKADQIKVHPRPEYGIDAKVIAPSWRMPIYRYHYAAGQASITLGNC